VIKGSQTDLALVHSDLPVTAILRGDYFSSQINVFVENTPLDVGEPVPVVVRPPRHRVKYPKKQAKM
jgi:hypothetical protein